MAATAAGGLGIALVPADAGGPQSGLPPGSLVPVLPDSVGRELAVRVLLRQDRAHTRRCREMVAVMRDMAQTFFQTELIPD